MQLRAVGRRCSTGSATVLGDLAQGTTPWATESWEASLGHLGKPAGIIEILVRGFRVPTSVIDYAARLLPSMAPGLDPPVSMRENPGRLEIVRVDVPSLYERVATSVVEYAREPGRSVSSHLTLRLSQSRKSYPSGELVMGCWAPTTETSTIRLMSFRPPLQKGWSSTESSSSSHPPSQRPSLTGARDCAGSMS